jgi:hypothetical protein
MIDYLNDLSRRKRTMQLLLAKVLIRLVISCSCCRINKIMLQMSIYLFVNSRWI